MLIGFMALTISTSRCSLRRLLRRYLSCICVMVERYSLESIVDSLQSQRWLECGMGVYTKAIPTIKPKDIIKSI